MRAAMRSANCLVWLTRSGRPMATLRPGATHSSGMSARRFSDPQSQRAVIELHALGLSLRPLRPASTAFVDRVDRCFRSQCDRGHTRPLPRDNRENDRRERDHWKREARTLAAWRRKTSTGQPCIDASEDLLAQTPDRNVVYLRRIEFAESVAEAIHVGRPGSTVGALFNMASQALELLPRKTAIARGFDLPGASACHFRVSASRCVRHDEPSP